GPAAEAQRFQLPDVLRQRRARSALRQARAEPRLLGDGDQATPRAVAEQEPLERRGEEDRAGAHQRAGAQDRRARLDGRGAGAPGAALPRRRAPRMPDPRAPGRQSGLMALDPVCGMTVDPAKAAGEFDYKGTKYYFCSKHCVHSFSSDPERYLSKKAGAAHVQHAAIPLQRIGRKAPPKPTAPPNQSPRPPPP